MVTRWVLFHDSYNSSKASSWQWVCIICHYRTLNFLMPKSMHYFVVNVMMPSLAPLFVSINFIIYSQRLIWTTVIGLWGNNQIICGRTFYWLLPVGFHLLVIMILFTKIFLFVIFYFLLFKDQDFSLQWVIVLQEDVWQIVPGQPFTFVD